MSPELHARCALAVLASAVLACGMGLLAWGPIAAGRFVQVVTDVAVGGSAVPSWIALLFLPGLVAAGLGWQKAAGRPHRMWREAWTVFFAVAALALSAAAAGQLLHGGWGDVVLRIPSASACAVVSLLFVAERLGRAWIARRALLAALASGPIAGLACWMAQVAHGVPDVRLLLWLEALPFLMIPLGVWGLRSRGLRGKDWLIALALLCFAELMGWAHFAWPEGTPSLAGAQAMHHVALSATVGWLAWSLGRQESPGRESVSAGVSAEATGLSSQRSTSRVTSR